MAPSELIADCRPRQRDRVELAHGRAVHDGNVRPGSYSKKLVKAWSRLMPLEVSKPWGAAFIGQPSSGRGRERHNRSELGATTPPNPKLQTHWVPAAASSKAAQRNWDKNSAGNVDNKAWFRHRRDGVCA
jgi:hypothetical protein